MEKYSRREICTVQFWHLNNHLLFSFYVLFYVGSSKQVTHIDDMVIAGNVNYELESLYDLDESSVQK